ncbi:MAG: type II toxin-antitoxin system prevent-host-death family antitoxin [Sphingomicrobium sp.]
MTLHVNIGEAKTRLSQLIAAAKRGEKVIIARDGEPEVELVALAPDRELQERIARRRAFFGSKRGQVGDIDWFEPNFTPEELDTFERPEF